jgi:ABC-2 type transport system ATP-binding protein
MRCRRGIHTVDHMPSTLAVESLTKRFGSVTAVADLSFSPRAGLVTGLVGRNGSGKSTTLRAALGLVRPTSGRVLVNGAPFTSLRRPLTEVGGLLDAEGVNAGLSGRAHLRWLCRSNAIGARRVDELLELVGLAAAGRRRVGTYSLGMKQRLGIAATLVGDPPILIFDEPMNGLDPQGMVWLRGFLRDRAVEGRVVLLSSHLMGELEGTADRVVIIDDGRLVLESTVEALVTLGDTTTVTVRTRRSVDVMAVLASAGASVTSTARDVVEVEGMTGERVAELIARHGLPLDGIDTGRRSLEDVFLQVTDARGAT